MPPQIVKCGLCKLVHWNVYSCAEAGWHDEDGWNPRPLGTPLPKPQDQVAAKHKTSTRWTAAEAKQFGAKGGKAKYAVMSKAEKQENARKMAKKRWDDWRAKKAGEQHAQNQEA